MSHKSLTVVNTDALTSHLFQCIISFNFENLLFWILSRKFWKFPSVRCGVCGSLARGTRNLSPAASRLYPMVLDDTAGATCARISSFMLFGRHHCSHNASILMCVCIMQPFRTWSTGVGMSHRPLLKAATHHRYTVPNMCSNPSICPSSFPQAYNVTPFRWPNCGNLSQDHIRHL